jgi:hypothetical protein
MKPFCRAYVAIAVVLFSASPVHGTRPHDGDDSVRMHIKDVLKEVSSFSKSKVVLARNLFNSAFDKAPVSFRKIQRSAACMDRQLD